MKPPSPARWLPAAALILTLTATAVPAHATDVTPADGPLESQNLELLPWDPGTATAPGEEPTLVPESPSPDPDLPAAEETAAPEPSASAGEPFPSASEEPDADPGEESLEELIGPLGARMGQGLDRLEETADPQVPGEAEEEVRELLEEKIETEGLSAVVDATIEAAAAPGTGAAAAGPGTTPFAALRATGLQGLDVSSHQLNVNWQQAWNQGARFAYVKATEATSYRNPYYRQQYDGSATTGMIRGAYHFAIPNVSSGAAQANYFVNNGGGWSSDGRTLPPLLDIEYNPYPELGDTCYNMSPSRMVSWIRDFSNTIKVRTGRLPMIYTTTDWWKTCTGDSRAFADHPLHLASYADSPGPLPSGWSSYTVWQYSSTGPFVGDSNVFRGTMDELRAFATRAQSFRTAQLHYEGVPASTKFGHTTDQFLACDWDGDGIDTPAVFRDGWWYLRSSLGGAESVRKVAYGSPGDQPLCGDWDGDGIDTLGVYRNGTAYLRNSNTSGRADGVFNYGERGDLALTGDWNNDGYDTLGVVRPSGISQRFYLTDSNIVPRVAQTFHFGARGDLPVSGDWNNDGYDTIGIRRGITWHLTNDTVRLATDRVLSYGNHGDRPLIGRWTVGGPDRVGIVR